jgi:hypothetical protein
MIFGKEIHHRILRNLVVSFGTIFNDISIERFNSSGDVVKTIKVPIAYGSKNKWMEKLRQDPNLENRVQFILPRMGFNIVSVSYDPARQMVPTGKRKGPAIGLDGSTVTRSLQYNPIPWTVNMELYIMVDLAEDGTQIVEQILPFFIPELTLTLKSIPEMDIHDDVPIILNGVVSEDTYEGDLNVTRSIIWTLSFMCKINFYGPVDVQGLIRKVIMDLYAVPGSGPITPEEVENTPRRVRITTTPDPSNAEPGDDYGFSTVLEEFDDNKQRNPATGEDEEIV